MPPVTLKERQKVNHQLKTLGFGGIDDPNLFAQIATLYKTHDSFRGLLMSTHPEQRRIAYEALRHHLCFTPKPLDVYERETKERAEREQWDIYDGSAYPKHFKVGEIESEEYKLERLAQEAIEQSAHENAKGTLELVCTRCTLAGYFPAPTRKQALKAAHDGGWRWAERNGVTKTYCPKDVPGRLTMKIRCSACERTEQIRAWDEQDGYAKARLAGWVIEDDCKCRRCSAPKLLLQ